MDQIQGTHRQVGGQILIDKSKHYEFIVNTSKELMALINRDYVYEAVNDAHCHARAQKREDIIGRTISDLWSYSIFTTTLKNPLDRCFSGEEVNYQANYEHEALGLRYMDVTCYPYIEEGSKTSNQVTHVVIVQRDITEREQAARALQRYAKRLETLHQIDRGILAAQSSEEIAQAALNHLQFLVPCQRAKITMFDSVQKISKLSDGGRDADEDVETQLAEYPNSYVLAEFLHADWNQPDQADVSSEFRIPLVAQNELLGELKLTSITTDDFSDEHREIVNEVASQVALAVQQAQLRQTLSRYTVELEDVVRQRTHEIEHRRQVAEGMRDVLTILNSVRPINEVLEFIMTQARLLMSTDHIAFFAGGMFEPDARNPLIRSLSIRSLSASEIFLCQKLIPEATSKLEPYVVVGDEINRLLSDFADDIENTDTSVPVADASTNDLQYKTYVCVPIRLNPEVYGSFLLFYSDEVALSIEEIETIASLSDQAALAIENARLYQRAEQLGIMEERERLARDMHDSVMQSIYSLTLFSSAGRRQLQKGNIPRVNEYFEQLIETAQQAMREMRLLLYELRPVVLEQEGLIGALRRRLNAVEVRAGININLDVPEPIVPPFYAEESLYRIAQEALNNSLKHSGADQVRIRILREDDTFVMQIVDNGKGFLADQSEESEGGMGLGNMRERMQKLQGDIHIESAPETGTTITVRVKVNDPAIYL